MARNGNNFMAILGISGMMVVLGLVYLPWAATADTGKVYCPLYCLDVSYTSCKCWGEKELKPYCNCCLLKVAMPHARNCSLHLTDGRVVRC
ncbi:hypothetical protein SUGI_0336550 [Cryptomeria japonica]|nr:hypothetical protein SUGI_0336550 [Cryptomeria japonica]